MPRFYFHLEDTAFTPDTQGAELPDLPAARLQATQMIGAILRDHAEDFWDAGLWRLLVTDEAQTILFRLEFRGASASRSASVLHLVQ